MVRHHLGRGGRGAPGKLSSDPAIRTAAVALLLGWSDPLDLLALDPADYAIAVEIVRDAQKMDSDRRRAELDALVKGIGATVANRVAALLNRSR